VRVEELADGLLEFLGAARNPTPKRSLGEKRERALDLVEPGAVRRREVEMEARVSSEPALDHEA
jgi:hypothetical protein